MDFRIGLDYIVENKEYTEKLATALDTNNVTVKKQIFELLSALCTYSAKGYQRSLETLQHYKEKKNARYRFKIVVDELRQGKNQDYKTAVTAFVNCVIISALSIKERVRIRNEFMGLKLLDILAQFRRECKENGDTDLAVQLDVFDEQKYTDEGQLTGPNGVDLSCHLDVFYAIFRQVSQSPQEIPFLSILQHLLRIDPCLPVSDIIWDTAEKLVHRATLCETKEDTEKLLRTPSYHHSLNKFLRNLQDAGGRCMCSCHKKECETTDGCGDNRVRKRTPLQLGFGPSDGTRTPGILSPTNSVSAFSPELLATLSRAISPPPASGFVGQRSTAPQQNLTSCAPPPPPPPPSSGPPPPPPPPLPPPSGCPPPPPPPPGCLPPPSTKSPIAKPIEEDIRLPQQFTPKPKNKMKSLNWTKIPSNKVVGKKNLWSLIAKTHDGSSNDLDFETMEGLFCQQGSSANGQQSPNLSGRERSPTDSLDRKKKESTEINLLDGKRSLNVNIFLKQFRSSNDDIIRLLREGCHEEVGAEKLRGLLKVLPESDEVELLKGFKDERSKLGNAEKFLLLLIELPSYKLRCEGMLLKEEFTANMSFLEPAIGSIVAAVQELKQCRELHEVLYMLLVAGNFLNSGGYAGDAAGFKMMSLLKIADTRANKPGMNLVHYVAQEANRKFPNLLKFMDSLPSLEDASKLSIDNLKTEITNLSQKVVKISQQVAIAEENIKLQMGDFLQLADLEANVVKKDIDNLNKLREDMAEFLCEDAQSFKLEECFKIFYGFCQKFKTAVEENEHRRQQEKRAEARRRQREEQLVARKKNPGVSENRPPSFSGSESDNIMDMLLGDIRSGFVHNRFGDSSFKARKAKKTDSPAELCRMNSLTSSLPSEEDVTNSPRVIRRRIGSLNSVVTNGESGEVDSPDVTPNGTIRRRRNRLSSDDHDDNLMDFLRQNAEGEISKVGVDKTKAVGSDSGSLDRSVLRRSSRSRRRADILASEFNDRERPASPVSTHVEKEIPDVERVEHHKPRQWRKKIEDWLQENEKEQLREKKFRERVNLEKWRRQEQEQRELDSAGSTIDRLEDHKTLGKNLETLHEAKTDSELYSHKMREVVQPKKTEKALNLTEAGQLKDKSKWRKSTLNVANSSESIDDERRRNRSRKSLLDIDSSPDDTISFYIRGPEEASKRTPCSPVQQLADLGADVKHADDKNTTQKPTYVESSIKSNSSVRDQSSGNINDLTRHHGDELKESDVNQNIANVIPQEIQVKNQEHPAIVKNRFYQSMREPSFNRVEEELKNTTLSDVSVENGKSEKEKQKGKESTALSQEKGISTPAKEQQVDEDDETNFDRFSFMRKTTRRTRPKQKVSESEENSSSPKTEEVTGDPNSEGLKTQVAKSTPDYVEAAIKDIGKASEEIQNLSDDNKRTGNVYNKNNNGGISRMSEMTPEEIRKKDKSTSLKARLSRRLLSLTENFKGMLSEGSDKKTPETESFPTEKASYITEPTTDVCSSVALNTEAKKQKETTAYDTKTEIQDIPYRQKYYNDESVKEADMRTSQSNYPVQRTSESQAQVSPIYSKSPTFSGKLKDEQDKDEGFEETQSQLSEVNSQGAFSSYDTDSVDSPRSSRQIKDMAQIMVNKLLPESPTESVPSNLVYSDAKIPFANLPLVTRSQTRQIPAKIPDRQNAKPRPTALCAPTVKRSLSNTSKKVLPPGSPVIQRSSVSRSQSNAEVQSGKMNRLPNLSSKLTKVEDSNKSRLTKTYSTRNADETRTITAKSSKEDMPREKGRVHRGSSERLPVSGKLNEPIGKRMAAYTKAIRNMTSNLNKSTGSKENYDVTQSMPPTPSEEDKTFASALTRNELRKSQRTRSSSAVNSIAPFKTSSRQSSQKSSPVGSRAGSRRSSERSLDLLSRKSSDRSLNLSRKSSETSIATVKSASRRIGVLPKSKSPDAEKAQTKKIAARKILPSMSPLIHPKSRAIVTPSKVVRQEKPVIVNPTKPRSFVRRSSSDTGTCSFMKATSSSSAKVSPTKPVIEPRPRSKPGSTQVVTKKDTPINRFRQR